MRFARTTSAVLITAVVIGGQPGGQTPRPTPDWARIRLLCIVRDHSGQPVTNLTKDQVRVLEEGSSRPVLEFSLTHDKPEILTISEGPRFLLKADTAITRGFSPSATRKILVIQTQPGFPPLVGEKRWDLIFWAERRGVVVYGMNPGSKPDRSLEEIATETGGRMVSNERELQADLAAQYSLVAEPLPLPPRIGRANVLSIEVTVPRMSVQAPHSYYIAPPWNEIQPAE